MSLDAGTAAVYTDFQALDRLRLGARENSPEVLHEVARQFESLFIQMMMKNMRAASFGDELFDSDQSTHYRDMFDSQMSLRLGEQGGFGLADLLVRQLGGDPGRMTTRGAAAAAQSHLPAGMPATSTGADRVVAPAGESAIASPEEFIRVLHPHAIEAAARLGVEPEALLAQAALETGWGHKMIVRPDGGNSHNLFGIKADPRWPGERASAVTLEYEGGIAVRRNESFRAYGSYAESFADYVDFLQSSPRYASALTHGGDSRHFIEGLQQAGYATDPDYAGKINRIMNSELLLGLV